MTVQRTAVYETLSATSDHPTAEALFFAVRAHLPTISLATVYNTLEALVESGMVAKIPGEGAARYDAVYVPHGHTRCLACGALTNLPESDMPALLAGLSLPRGFQVQAITMEITGLCAACVGVEHAEHAAGGDKHARTDE